MASSKRAAPNHAQIDQAVEQISAEMIRFAQQLVQTPSLPGNEQAVQKIITQKLQHLNLQVEIIPSIRQDLEDHPAFCDDGVPFQDRINVVGKWRGVKTATNFAKGRSLILNGHVDVVSPGDESLWRHSPWSGRIENGNLYGRGSCDMKSGLSAAIFAVEALQKIGFQPGGEVLLQSVIGEESGGVGTLTTLVAGYRADAAVIMEPTRLRICPTQAGAMTFRLKIHGKAAHACLKNTGVCAIEKMIPIFKALEAFDRKRHARRQNPVFSDPNCIAPISIGTVRAGDWHSSVPEILVAEGRAGVFPGEALPEARKAFETVISKTAAQDEWLAQHPPAVAWFEGQFEPGETPLDSAIVKNLRAAHKETHSADPEIQGVTYGSDLRLFTNHGNVPAVLYGPGDVAQAHTVDEFIEIEQIVQCAKVLAHLIVNWTRGTF